MGKKQVYWSDEYFNKLRQKGYITGDDFKHWYTYAFNKIGSIKLDIIVEQLEKTCTNKDKPYVFQSIIKDYRKKYEL